MATESKCPKCGAKTHDWLPYPAFLCGTEVDDGKLRQSDTCRVRELEAENAKLRAAGDGLADAVDNSGLGILDPAVAQELAAWHEAKGGGDGT